MSEVAGGAGNLIANTFHGPANFKPISSVYCQSQRARNSSLSARNEILPVVPFRRSPCPFDLHWRRLGNLRDTTLSRYLNERAPSRFTTTEAGLAVPSRFTYLEADEIRDRSNRVSSTVSRTFALFDSKFPERIQPLVYRLSSHRSYRLIASRSHNPTRCVSIETRKRLGRITPTLRDLMHSLADSD